MTKVGLNGVYLGIGSEELDDSTLFPSLTRRNIVISTYFSTQKFIYV